MILDTQSVKNTATATGATVGFDAGKLVKGRKRLVLTDTLGHVLASRVLAAEFASVVTPDERLREMHFGAWENRAWNDLSPAETAPWMADYVTLAPPGGETFGAVQLRAAAFLAELADGSAAGGPGPVLVFSHGGTIRALVADCLEIPLRNAFQLRIDFASITKIQRQHGRWNLLTLNS